MKTTADRKTELEARLAKLLEDVREIDHDLRAPHTKDDDDRVTEQESDEAMQSLGRMEVQEIQMIRAALERVDDGSYGECVKCGSEILSERLDLLPHTPFCRNCAV